MYGKRSNDFIEGVIVGIETYAVWNDGVQHVGVLGKPLKEVIQEVKEQLGWKEQD